MNGIKIRAFTFDLSNPLKAFVKSFIWLICVFACGSLPVLMVWFLRYLGIGEADKKLNAFGYELFLPFLCCAIIGEISFEAFLCKIRFSKFSYLFFGLSAFIVIGIVCLLYVIFFFYEPQKIFNSGDGVHKLPSIWVFQSIIVTYTVLYSLCIKTFMFFEDDKRQML